MSEPVPLRDAPTPKPEHRSPSSRELEELSMAWVSWLPADWLERQRERIRARMAAYTEAWAAVVSAPSDQPLRCADCNVPLSGRQYGLVLSDGEHSSRFCGACRNWKWSAAGHRYGLYP